MDIILDTSEKAAKFVENISGWVDRNGMFFGNNKNSESAARYSGCTHRACDDCGEPAEKMYTVCSQCRDKRDAARYAQLEREEWDEKVPVYSAVADRYFSSWDEVNDYIEDDQPDKHYAALRLVICEPVFLSTIETEHWCDDLPDPGEYGEYDFPKDIIDALDALNDAIKKHGPVSWTPGKKAVLL